MSKQITAVLLALGMVMACAVRVSAQEVVTVPSGGLRHLELGSLEAQLGAGFQAACLTLPPAADKGVLYLDGKPLRRGKALTRAQLSRVFLFSSGKEPYISFGMTAFPERRVNGPESQRPRVRCINPYFDAHTSHTDNR